MQAADLAALNIMQHFKYMQKNIFFILRKISLAVSRDTIVSAFLMNTLLKAEQIHFKKT